ncbi:MAG: hypothetical protein CM1200mP29_10600 [Verrucomicrobiota bacterium]|nr:MAG: hypothetical protein CM1200mP29_10600 [Verrucomicrobiota bacterium]
MARAEFYLGEWPPTGPVEPTNLLDALPHYQRVANEMSNSPLNPSAWGRIGDCHLQLGNLDSAMEAYRTVTELPSAD